MEKEDRQQQITLKKKRKGKTFFPCYGEEWISLQFSELFPLILNPGADASDRGFLCVPAPG
jgi:hypothetical protein